MARRTQEEMRRIRDDIISFIKDNKGKASYGELFTYLEAKYNFNDSQLSSLLYRMSANWYELTRPENGIYRLNNEDEFVGDSHGTIKDETVNKFTIPNRIRRDLLEMIEDYKVEVVNNLLTLSNAEVIETKKMLKKMDEIIE